MMPLQLRLSAKERIIELFNENETIRRICEQTSRTGFRFHKFS
jgi:hypothetical protein